MRGAVYRRTRMIYFAAMVGFLFVSCGFCGIMMLKTQQDLRAGTRIIYFSPKFFVDTGNLW